MQRTLVSAIGVIALFATACKHAGNASTVKYGMINAFIPSSLFLTLPGETVAVCAKAGAEAQAAQFVTAIKSWFAAANRSQVPVAEGCTGDRVVNIEIMPWAGYFGLTYPNTDQKNHQFLVKVVANASPLTAMHESGHLFGFCDLYSNGIDQQINANCTTNNGIPGPSVMNSSANGGVLSSEDLAGIQAMLARPELASATAAWQAVSRKDSSTSAPVTTPATAPSAAIPDNSAYQLGIVGSVSATGSLILTSIATGSRAETMGWHVGDEIYWANGKFIKGGLADLNTQLAAAKDLCVIGLRTTAGVMKSITLHANQGYDEIVIKG